MDKHELVYKGNRALHKFSQEITLNGLKIASHTTEELVVKSQRRREDIVFRIGQNLLNPVKCIECLEIWLG